ncbi:hypothetical protein HDU98_003646 [Podochytrium sp. JEL0797]|nr:hypothetical protein HDU98_003646 [Podochytrium sp. JEL0797]
MTSSFSSRPADSSPRRVFSKPDGKRGGRSHIRIASLVVGVAQTRVKDVAPFACIKSLRELDIEDTRVIRIAPLASLPLLEALKFSDHVLDVECLSKFKNLKVVNGGEPFELDSCASEVSDEDDILERMSE